MSAATLMATSLSARRERLENDLKIGTGAVWWDRHSCLLRTDGIIGPNRPQILRPMIDRNVCPTFISNLTHYPSALDFRSALAPLQRQLFSHGGRDANGADPIRPLKLLGKHQSRCDPMIP